MCVTGVALMGMEVPVRVNFSRVVVVSMHVYLALAESPECLHAEEYQHNANQELEDQSEVLRYANAKQQQSGAGQKQGCGVPQAPRDADPDRAQRVPIFADYGGYGNQVVRVKGMPGAKHQAEDQHFPQ